MATNYIKLPMFLYAPVKKILSRIILAKYECNILIVPLSIIITVLLLIPIILMLLTLGLYRALVDLRLQKIYKESYRGLMGGIDAICCHQDNCIPHMLGLVEFNGSLEELKKAVIKQLEKTKRTKHKKLYYSIGEYMGYHFYFNEDIPAEDYVTIMETNEKMIDHKNISEIFMPYNKAPMPCNGRKLIHVVICPQPAYLNDNSDIKAYYINYRYHHCAGDGKTALDIVSGCFADNYIPEPMKLTHNAKKTKISLRDIKKFFTDVSIKDLPGSVSDRNALRGYALTEDKHIVWFSDSDTGYIDKIRNIKKCYNNVTFLDIMNTCLTLSLYDYYKKKELPVPDSVCSGLVLRPDITNFTAYGSKEFEMVNKFSVACVTLPVGLKFQGDKRQGMLTFLKNEYATLRKSFDIHFNYFVVLRITNLIPSPIMRKISSKIEFTIGISSIPGFDEITFFGGNKVRDVVIFPPNSPGTGLHIIFNSYKRHLRISLTADSSVTPKHEDAQQIVDGIISHLDELYALCSNGAPS